MVAVLTWPASRCRRAVLNGYRYVERRARRVTTQRNVSARRWINLILVAFSTTAFNFF